VPCRSRRRHRAAVRNTATRTPHLSNLPSAALSLLGILALIYGLKEATRSGLDTRAATALLVGLLAGGLFIRRQRTLADPLLDLRLFRSAAFSSALAAMLASVFVIDGTFLFLSQYLQLLRGPSHRSPPRSGCYPRPAAWSPDQSSRRFLSRYIPAARLIAAGLLTAAAGIALFTRIEPAHGLTPSRRRLTPDGDRKRTRRHARNDFLVAAAPPEQAGTAAAISETGADSAAPSASRSSAVSALPFYHTHLHQTLPAGLTAVQNKHRDQHHRRRDDDERPSRTARRERTLPRCCRRLHRQHPDHRRRGRDRDCPARAPRNRAPAHQTSTKHA